MFYTQALSADLFLKVVEEDPDSASFSKVYADTNHMVHAVFDVGGQLVSLCHDQFMELRDSQIEGVKELWSSAVSHVEGAQRALAELKSSRASNLASNLRLAFDADAGMESETDLPETDPIIYFTPFGPAIFGLQCLHTMCKTASIVSTVGSCRSNKTILRVV